MPLLAPLRAPLAIRIAAAFLIMPLLLAAGALGAQMVPVAPDPSSATPPPLAGDAPAGKLYLTADPSPAGGTPTPAGDTSSPAADPPSPAADPSSTAAVTASSATGGSRPAADASSTVDRLASSAPASSSAVLAAQPLSPASLPAPPSAATSFSSSAAPAAGVTLPPKPTRVRDLPEIGQGESRVRPFRAAAFGLTASTLGAGAELAIPIARTWNLRVGGSYLNWRYPFSSDGIDYNPGLKFTSGRGTLDWFPHHGAFHLSAGALYFRNTIAGAATVLEGQQFSLGGTTYINSVDDPVGGTATVTYGKQIAPLVLIGFGNILPRSGRHISVPFEIGGAYMQPPTLSLKLAGTACTNQGCFNAGTDPQVQANLQKEVNSLQGDIHFLQIYPVVSLGLACRF